jgi:SAM-dependent methyltransferase
MTGEASDLVASASHSASRIDLDLDARLDGPPAPPPDATAEVDRGAAHYADPAYWEERYELFRFTFDWYHNWDELQPVIGHFFCGAEFVLHLGCGTSPLGADVAPFFRSVVNIDISTVAIRRMAAAHASRSNVSWLVMDCTQLAFRSSLFDVVFDKGTLDALFCGADGLRKAGLTLSEVHRVLRPGGLFFEITYGAPEYRLRAFNQVGLAWELLEPITVENAERDTVHWIYVFRKAR